MYYTPAPVVQAQVRLVADLLERCFACAGGFADPRVLVVDPAAGSGAYPLAVREHLRQQHRYAGARMRVLEPTIGAALIARAAGLEVEERDALAAPLEVNSPIAVCLGNPPYARGRGSDLKGGFVRFGAGAVGPLVEDFKVGASGVHHKNLYNTYVYFWRWAVWHIFEQRSGAGIVSLVTAASYLRGPGFGGMRRMLRRALDELWLIDLEGDRLAARTTTNVFPIRTPVAIAIGVRYAQPWPESSAAVHYTRLLGSPDDKLGTLERLRSLQDLRWQTAAPSGTGPFVPRSSAAGYAGFPGLIELFPWQVSGAQLKRTWPIATSPETLRARWKRLLELAPDERASAFRETRDRDLDASPPDLRDPATRLAPLRGLAPGAACIAPVRYAYRSFDRQWVLPDARLGDFLRPALWRSIGPGQVFLTSLLTNVLGPGPAAVATRLVPDLDHFRGSYGARAVIPLWCDAAGTRPNVAAGVLERLGGLLGFGVAPAMLFAYCYAVLATRKYVVRFADELLTPGPRIPLTDDGSLFKRVAALGQRILSLHTYTQVVVGSAWCMNSVGDTHPPGFVYDAVLGVLHVGDGRFGPIPPSVWHYSVSGLPIVRSWLRYRLGPRRRASSPLDSIGSGRWTAEQSRELLELVWLLEATLNLEPSLDAALDAVLASGHISLRPPATRLRYETEIAGLAGTT